MHNGGEVSTTQCDLCRFVRPSRACQDVDKLVVLQDVSRSCLPPTRCPAQTNIEAKVLTSGCARVLAPRGDAVRLHTETFGWPGVAAIAHLMHSSGCKSECARLGLHCRSCAHSRRQLGLRRARPLLSNVWFELRVGVALRWSRRRLGVGQSPALWTEVALWLPWTDAVKQLRWFKGGSR